MPRLGIAGTLVFAAALLPAISYAQDAADSSADDAIPPALTQYLGRQIAPTMGYQGAPWLTRKTRAEEEHSDELLTALGIKPGSVVCDMGCGNGYHTLKMAEAVGEKGRVLAVDIQPEMLRLLEARVAEAGYENVEPVHGTLIDPRLPADSVDLVLIVDVYHEFSHPVQMLDAIRKSLKPDGRMVLVEFRGEDPFVPIKPLHKMTKKQVLREMAANGFKLVEQYDALPWQHVLFFGRDDASSE